MKSKMLEKNRRKEKKRIAVGWIDSNIPAIGAKQYPHNMKLVA